MEPIVAPQAPTLYQQLADDLSLAIKRGTLPPGAKLPSVRRTSQSRQLSLNTVVAAYRVLEDRGLIEARPQSGYYVRARLPSPARPAATLSSPAAPTRPQVLGLIDTVLEAQQNEDYIDLALACPHGGDFYPGSKLGRLMGQILRRQPGMVSRYALPPGSLRLRTQIARRGLELGMTLQAQDIVLTHGCMEALQLALRAVTRPGDTVGLESPTYFNLLPLIASLGLKTVEIPTDPQTGLSIDAVELLLAEKRINALVAMPNVHNPLGSTMPLEAKKRLARMITRHQVPLIEDALYAELQFGDTLAPAVKAFDDEGWVIVCSSYTKTLAPDFRIGWMEGGRFGHTLRQLKFASSVAEPAVLAETLGAFLESGGYDHHLRALKRRYAAHVEKVRGMIARHFPAGTHATAPSGGFLIWVELPEDIDAVALFHAAIAEKISIMPGPLYSPSGRYPNALRLSCCYPLDERYLAALARVGVLAGQLRRS
ncbi:PLP-dependent aminotransferase family protein [Chromobacterium haemolyticum]|uniref:Putative 8-amino-7-oxononanoate synthase n=1 Tax=Chromobacterium haemolyticum TaxID=394935 RepID=A0ABS3GK85_9NEIS|nr:PLP-dependent aminotransferase family protein [Chromobacterium haemolyticum]MBK0413954.1 PLP-dependent aminotransferase family protein [Chromobacterium haemolyticum]MBO0415359.1 PLP-dependent aminotransferase family protein [Chromobacterium haemolyticum]MBO0498620.1 PLP-dependent aminotransferase family protein [Chromobacterium haemolyticum]QOD84113.1 PLP-dependent aminotransferase family protein [Chromobacterium haemolyticum]BBH12160.1 transcriptional regulator [Chromobacterium haemolyticu